MGYTLVLIIRSIRPNHVIFALCAGSLAMCRFTYIIYPFFCIYALRNTYAYMYVARILKLASKLTIKS